METRNVYRMSYRLRSFKLEVVNRETGDTARVPGAWGEAKTEAVVARDASEAAKALTDAVIPGGPSPEDAERGQEIQILSGAETLYSDVILALPAEN